MFPGLISTVAFQEEDFNRVVPVETVVRLEDQHGLEDIIHARPLSPSSSPGLKAESSGVATVGLDAAVGRAPESSEGDPSSEYHHFCRICHENYYDEDNPVKPLGCNCKMGLGFAHVSCAEDWFGRKQTNVCEVCKDPITMELDQDKMFNTVDVTPQAPTRHIQAWNPPSEMSDLLDMQVILQRQVEHVNRMKKTTAAVQLVFVLAVILLIHRSVQRTDQGGFQIQFMLTLFILCALLGLARGLLRVFYPVQAQQLNAQMWAVYTVAAASILLTWIILINQE